MKEICIINYGSNAAAYGIGTHIKEYIHCLRNIGFKINLIELGTDNKYPEIYIKEEINLRTFHIPYIQKSNFVIYNKAVCRLLRLYLKDSSDLIFHFHYLQSSSLLVRLKQYFPLSKSILTIHYLYWSARFNGNITIYKDIIKQKSRKYTKKKYQDVIYNYEQEKKYIQSVDQVICLAEDTYNLLKDFYNVDTEKLFIIPNGLKPYKAFISKEKQAELRKQYYITENERIILFVGRINQIKGIQPLISAFEKVVATTPSCRLVLIGDGDFSSVVKQSYNASTRISFTGKINKEKLHQWYQIADIGVFPSYYEESSYVGIEMLMHGLPIIASDGYAVKNMFNSQNAIIASINNWNKPESFTSSLTNSTLALLQSDELLVLKRRQALQSYKATFHLKHMQQKYKTLLAKL